MTKKYARNSVYTLIISTLISFLILSSNAQAQTNRAGSHLNANSIPSHIMQLSQPNEVDQIRELLTEGKNNDALLAAQKFLQKVEGYSLIQETTAEYYALNTICTVYIHLGQFDDAINSCSAAMTLKPQKWSAANNRATAYLVAGDYDNALQDYQLALSIAPINNSAIVDTIKHNINLIDDRKENDIN